MGIDARYTWPLAWVACFVLVGCLGPGCDSKADTCVVDRAGPERRVVRLSGDCRGRSFEGVDLSAADTSGVTWGGNVCPDGTRSDEQGGSCLGHLSPATAQPDLGADLSDLSQDSGPEEPPEDMPPEDSAPDLPGEELGCVAPNACGGCGPLPGQPGQPCGLCRWGRWACQGQGLVCQDDSACLESCQGEQGCPQGECVAGRCVPAGLAWIPGGTFTEGAHGEGEFEPPTTRRTTLGRDFLADRREETQRGWSRLVGNAPSAFRGCSELCPVESITWFEAVAYANLRSAQDGLEPCYRRASSDDPYGVEAALVQELPRWVEGVGCQGWRLPTAAEWERMARAGTLTRWGCGDDPACLEGIARYGLEAEDGPTAVGSLRPNAWGLYDTHGNIAEWCWDWYETLQEEAATDPIGPTSGTLRVQRGGHFSANQEDVRPGFLNASPPSLRDAALGVRLVRSLP